MQLELSGEVALVIGGASGIGAVTARAAFITGAVIDIDGGYLTT